MLSGARDECASILSSDGIGVKRARRAIERGESREALGRSLDKRETRWRIIVLLAFATAFCVPCGWAESLFCFVRSEKVGSARVCGGGRRDEYRPQVSRALSQRIILMSSYFTSACAHFFSSPSPSHGHYGDSEPESQSTLK